MLPFGLLAVSNPSSPGFWEFFKLGIAHIWTGYDHLLFLLGLLIVCRTFRSIVGIISCFTVAHSITLGLATLKLVNLPSRLIEPMIAASICYVGVENILRRGGERKGRWALTFGFGLIHGFGFATVLRELGAGASGHGLRRLVPAGEQPGAKPSPSCSSSIRFPWPFTFAARVPRAL